MTKQANTNQQKSRRLTVRFSPKEHKRLETAFKKTTKRKLSEYVRAVLLDKPVTVYTRSQSLDDGLAVLRDMNYQLSAIGNNLNQAVKRLHTLKHIPEVVAWAKTAEKVYAQTMEQQMKIEAKIQQIFGEWLRE